MTLDPSLKEQPPKISFFLILLWSTLAVVGGAMIYAAFTSLTGAEESLIGIPVGLAIGQSIYYSSGKRGGRWYQALAAFLSYVAFDITYAPGIAGVAFKHGVTILAFGFFTFITLVSPLIDSHNGHIGQLMVAAGMYVAWILARRRTIDRSETKAPASH
jgi:hypothetical protein